MTTLVQTLTAVALGAALAATASVNTASAQCQGRSSTVTCRWPTRGETARAPAPKTGTIRKFSVR